VQGLGTGAPLDEIQGGKKLGESTDTRITRPEGVKKRARKKIDRGSRPGNQRNSLCQMETKKTLRLLKRGMHDQIRKAKV